MSSQDSPGPGRASPITISAPASSRGFIPLTARSAALGHIAEYAGDANLDTFVNSESDRPTITDASPAVDGQTQNPTTLDAGIVPPPPSLSRLPTKGEDHTSPQGDLPSQDHVDPASSPASPLANALAQMANALTTVTTGISTLSDDSTSRKPYLEGAIDVDHEYDHKKNDFKQWTKDVFEHLGTLRKGVYHDQLVGDMVWAHQRSQNDRKHWVFRDKQLYTAQV